MWSIKVTQGINTALISARFFSGLTMNKFFQKKKFCFALPQQNE
jgi:hypothetical protein